MNAESMSRGPLVLVSVSAILMLGSAALLASNWWTAGEAGRLAEQKLSAAIYESSQLDVAARELDMVRRDFSQELSRFERASTELKPMARPLPADVGQSEESSRDSAVESDLALDSRDKPDSIDVLWDQLQREATARQKAERDAESELKSAIVAEREYRRSHFAEEERRVLLGIEESRRKVKRLRSEADDLSRQASHQSMWSTSSSWGALSCLITGAIASAIVLIRRRAVAAAPSC